MTSFWGRRSLMGFPHLTSWRLSCYPSPIRTSPIIPAADYLALPRNAENWLLRPLLPVGGSMILYGDPKVGKSYAALQLAVALTGDGPDEWLGFPTGQAGPVVYVHLDTPRSLWAERLEELKREGHPIESDLRSEEHT